MLKYSLFLLSPFLPPQILSDNPSSAPTTLQKQSKTKTLIMILNLFQVTTILPLFFFSWQSFCIRFLLIFLASIPSIQYPFTFATQLTPPDLSKVSTSLITAESLWKLSLLTLLLSLWLYFLSFLSFLFYFIFLLLVCLPLKFFKISSSSHFVHCQEQDILTQIF